MKSTGILPENATRVDFRRLTGDESRVDGVPEELREESQINVTKPGTDFELRRDALLEAINSGGLEVSRDLGFEDASASANIKEASTKYRAATPEDVESQSVDDQPRTIQDVEQSASRGPDATTAVTDPPLTDQVSLGTSRPRSKLDLASSRRLLFGSLGLPTPKNKQDELNIREQLMKDVKRTRPSESQIEAEAGGTFTVGEPEENEQWKDKIVLKAVECCYDGIELSTPPFPFVQRWDPQQQSGYEELKRARNFRRNKKRKRNDEQFYQQVPIDTLEDGKFDPNPVAPGIEEQLDENSSPPEVEQQQQIASRRDGGDYEVAINDQLMREADASAIASAENGTTQDLPMLPEDMSACAPLTKEASLPGAVVAFKQLDMSQETNWQPRVSGYRTARVERLMENGIVRMSLAKRDHPQVQKSYDQQTGERIYSKFEMPGFNDDESLENGIAELSFAELIEPKLIRFASAEPLGMDDHQYSSRGGGLLKEDLTGESTGTNLFNIPSPKLPYNSINGVEPDREREEVRKEIVGLIKDAGWRSSIRSNIVQERGSGENLSPRDQAGDGGQELVDPISPKFLGFSSSPLRVGAISELSHSVPTTSPRSANILEVAESLPYQRISRPESPLKRMSSYGDEDLDIKTEDADEDQNLVGNDHQPKPGLPGADYQVSSQQVDSSKSSYQSVPTNTHNMQHDSPAKELILTDGTESDEFPMVEDIFSQIRSSHEPSSVGMEDSTYMGSSSFETNISKDESISNLEARKMKPDGKENFSEKRTLFKWGKSKGNEDPTPQHASQVPVQSQVVDLTLSSDPADSDYVDYSTQLPSGPGWAKKKKASGRRFGSVETSNRRSRRTRSNSYQALT